MRKNKIRILAFLCAFIVLAMDVFASVPDDLDYYIATSSNMIEDVDVFARGLVPLTSEEMEFIRGNNNEKLGMGMDSMPEYVPQGENKGRSAALIGQALSALVSLFLSSFCSTISTSSSGIANTMYGDMQSYASKGSDWMAELDIIYNGMVQTAFVTAFAVQRLLDKTEDSAISGGGVSLSLDVQDGTTLMYLLKQRGFLTTLNPDNVMVEAVADYPYYYISTTYYSSDSCFVLYSPVPIAFAVWDDIANNCRFYAVINAAAQPLQPVLVLPSDYTLDYDSGLYTLDHLRTAQDGIAVSAPYLRCMPFNTVRYGAHDSYYNSYVSGTGLFNNLQLEGKTMTVDSIMNLGDIYVKGDVSRFTTVDKNMYGRVTPLNPAAGAVITADMAGVGEDTDNPDAGGGTGGSVDLSGILGLLQSIFSALRNLPASIALSAITALASSDFARGITLNLDTIKSALSDIAKWDFADWTISLGAALLLALRTVSGELGLDTISGALDNLTSTLGDWDFADWTTALGATLLLSLRTISKELGFDGIASTLNNLLGTIGKWDFADWTTALGATLLASLLSFANDMGLGRLASLLDDIKNLISSIPQLLSDIKDGIIAIPGNIVSALKDLLLSLFVPSEAYFTDQVSLTSEALRSVLPYQDYIVVLHKLKSLSSGELEDITIDASSFRISPTSTPSGKEITIVSFAGLRSALPTVRKWVRGLFFCLLLIYHINQVYKLIRGTTLYEGMVGMWKGD